jgi:hypothetical protein
VSRDEYFFYKHNKFYQYRYFLLKFLGCLLKKNVNTSFFKNTLQNFDLMTPVSRIRIRIRINRILMFLGLLDPDPDQSVSDMEPDPDPDLDPSITKPKK